MSWILRGSMGMLTISYSPCPNGMSSSRDARLGTKCWLCAKFLLGSQSLLCRIALARSQIDSEIVPHPDGHGFPPKLKQSIIRRRPISSSCVQVWTAVAAFWWHHQKADLKSNSKQVSWHWGSFVEQWPPSLQFVWCMLWTCKEESRRPEFDCWLKCLRIIWNSGHELGGLFWLFVHARWWCSAFDSSLAHWEC